MFAVVRAGDPAVALLGNRPSPSQLAQLLDVIRDHQVKKILVWLDREARCEAYELYLRLRPLIETVLVDYEGAKDPGELAPDQVDAVLQEFT